MYKQRQLTLTQKRFVEEYMLDKNAKNAAIRSGYSAKAATNSGPRLLKNALVSAQIEEKTAQLSIRTGVTKERVIQELARIAFVNFQI